MDLRTQTLAGIWPEPVTCWPVAPAGPTLSRGWTVKGKSLYIDGCTTPPSNHTGGSLAASYSQRTPPPRALKEAEAATPRYLFLCLAWRRAGEATAILSPSPS